MIQMINGRRVEVPTTSDGVIDADTLRRVSGVPADRVLVLQLPDGGNKLVNPGEKLRLAPEQYFLDAPQHTRGRTA